MKFMLALAAVVALASAASPFSRTLKPLPPLRQPAPAPRQAFASAKAFAAPSQPTFARVSNSDQNANIIRYDSEQNPDGSYSYAIETDNGIAQQESGQPRNLGGNPPVIPVVAQGSFSYTSPEGQNVAVTYVADENGFQPSGEGLPQAPPIPPQILRALEWIARNPQSK